MHQCRFSGTLQNSLSYPGSVGLFHFQSRQPVLEWNGKGKQRQPNNLKQVDWKFSSWSSPSMIFNLDSLSPWSLNWHPKHHSSTALQTRAQACITIIVCITFQLAYWIAHTLALHKPNIIKKSPWLQCFSLCRNILH